MRRTEDQSPTLWNLFNEVQENMLQGVRYRYRRGQSIRSLKSIDARVKINKGLWALTEAFASNKRDTVAV